MSKTAFPGAIRTGIACDASTGTTCWGPLCVDDLAFPANSQEGI